MITGFNTDVDHQGQVFHVQTEDKGVGNPVIESLIYCGGEILDSRQSSYADLAGEGQVSEEEILGRMEAQHKGLIREIFNGRYDTEAPKPFGHNIITDRSLDEVVMEFLSKNARQDPIRLVLIDEQILREGTRPTLRLQVQDEASEDAVAGASVFVRLISTEGEPRELFSGETDSDGYVEAAFEIPLLSGTADAALLVRASAAGQRAEARQLVAKPKAELA